MTITVTDLFCGAGGSSLGAEEVADVQVEMAANHWATAVEVHQAHFPGARHDCADISQADPRRYPATNILLASPECTNHSQARGVSRRRQHADLFGDYDPAAERSRATMWDVGRFAEQLHYDAIVVENVVEATKWSGWPHWLAWLTDLGYRHRVLSHNSMHHGVPQSRDRIYVVFWRAGLRPELDIEVTGWCGWCETVRPARQAWKPNRTVGRYRQQWTWACTTCGREVRPPAEPAASIIDWGLPCPRIGDRARPLAAATRARILAGLRRYGWVPVTTAGAGHVYERTAGMRARPLTDPLPVQHATGGTAVATPPGFLFQTAHGGRVVDLEQPHPTVCGSDDRHALVITSRTNADADTVGAPLRTVVAGGNHHGLLVRSNGFEGSGQLGRFTTDVDEPMPTLVTTQRPALLMRNNGGGAEMVTPADEPDAVIDDCGFRMLEPHEIAAAMAFPDGYIPTRLSKKDRVRLAGNAVTPPVMAWIVGRLAQALEAAR